MKITVMLSLMLLIVSEFLLIPDTTADYTAETQWRLPEGAKARLGKGSIQEIKLSPDRTRLAVASSIGIWLYDAPTGEVLDLLTGHTGKVWSVSFSPDGQTLASGSSDRTVRLWDVNTGEHLHTLTANIGNNYSISFSPESQTLASGNLGDADVVRLWDVNTGKHIRTLKARMPSVDTLFMGPQVVYGVSFSPDGRTLVGGHSEGTIGFWNVKTGKHLHTLTGHTGDVKSVSFSPDGGTLASGSEDGTVLLWELGP